MTLPMANKANTLSGHTAERLGIITFCSVGLPHRLAMAQSTASLTQTTFTGDRAACVAGDATHLIYASATQPAPLRERQGDACYQHVAVLKSFLMEPVRLL